MDDLLKKEVGKRLREFRKTINEPVKRFAFKINTSPSYLYQIENGFKPVPADSLIYLIKEYGMNLNWLFTGEGEMLVKSANERRQEEFAQEFARRLREPVGPYSPARQEKIQKMIKQIKERLKADIAALDELLELEEKADEIIGASSKLKESFLLRGADKSGE